ncbi:hypothetical protein EX30DRAFT_212044 [Ascodesmis nigricans]|uniref:Uncharacterized protein n=1 Tax=Ascodesmis nigricans TaxID=341454 RepID=A0A4S2MP51_9PEZI|nr:hypothetical protein EX30DRAFT_212044 [Ascodesmis nigricans]
MAFIPRRDAGRTFFFSSPVPVCTVCVPAAVYFRLRLPAHHYRAGVKLHHSCKNVGTRRKIYQSTHHTAPLQLSEYRIERMESSESRREIAGRRSSTYVYIHTGRRDGGWGERMGWGYIESGLVLGASGWFLVLCAVGEVSERR